MVLVPTSTKTVDELQEPPFMVGEKDDDEDDVDYVKHLVKMQAYHPAVLKDAFNDGGKSPYSSSSSSDD